METSQKYGFNLPSRDGDDIADINLISDNFRIVEVELNSLDEKANLNAENIDTSNIQLENVTTMVENAVTVAGDALISARMAQETANSADTTALEAYERSASAESKASEAKVVAEEAQLQANRVEHIADALSKNELLYNIEGNNWELLGSDEEVTAYTLINDVSVNLLADRYYNFSIITPKSGDFATLRVGNYGEFLLKYSDDRYVGKIVFPTRFVGISGWVVEIQNPTDTTYLLSASAPILIEEEILPDRVKVYLDSSPVWEESTNDEATQYRQGIMHVINDLELAEDKVYNLSFSLGFQYTDAYVQNPPDAILVKKTANDEYVKLPSKRQIVNDGVISGEFLLNSGVEQGETLYLSVMGDSYVEFDTSSSEVVIEWVSNTKEILDYLSLNSGGNDSLGDIEAALDGIIAIQNELIGGDEE